LDIQGWNAEKDFTDGFMKAMTGGDQSVMLATILFSGPKTFSAFRACSSGRPDSPPSMEECGVTLAQPLTGDMGSAQQTLSSLQFPEGTTMTSMALALALDQIQEGRQDAESVVVLVTDGKPMFARRTADVVEEVKKKARLVIAAIGPDGTDDATLDLMKGWVTPPWRDNLIVIPNFSTMLTPQQINKLISTVCREAD